MNVLRDNEEAVLDSAKKDSVCGMMVEGVMRTLNNHMAIGAPGDWRLTPVTRTNREIIRLFSLEEPKSGRIVIQ